MTQAIDPTRAQFDAFKALPRDTPIQMLNLIHLRQHADYPEGHPNHGKGMTGAEAYRAYGKGLAPFLGKLGGRQVWAGRPEAVLTGPDKERWDLAFIIEYPGSAAFLSMVTDADYKEIVKHRTAGVEDSRLIRLAPIVIGDRVGDWPGTRFREGRSSSTAIKGPPMAVAEAPVEKPFLSDIKTLRARARANIADGAITPAYRGDVDKAIEILQAVLATEIVCVLRYTQNAISASGISSEGVKDEFLEHAKEEREHMMAVANRINQLGGKPNFNPEGLATRSASEYKDGPTLVDMIKENLIAERIAVEHYRELIRYFHADDPTTERMLKWILSVEEEHADDMHDLLVAHEGKPMLPS